MRFVPKALGAGSTFAAPIIEAWLAAYTEVHPAFEASYAAIGSGDGIERLLAGEIDSGASDAPLEAGTLPREAVRVPVTAGAVSLVTDVRRLRHRRPDDPRASSTEAPLRWALSDGQALAEPLGHVALPERVVDAALGGAGS